jgi:hypothetical protein
MINESLELGPSSVSRASPTEIACFLLLSQRPPGGLPSPFSDPARKVMRINYFSMLNAHCATSFALCWLGDPVPHALRERQRTSKDAKHRSPGPCSAFEIGNLAYGIRKDDTKFTASPARNCRFLSSVPYRFSASSTLTEARPLTSSPALCSKSAIAALLFVPMCPSGSPPMS